MFNSGRSKQGPVVGRRSGNGYDIKANQAGYSIEHNDDGSFTLRRHGSIETHGKFDSKFEAANAASASKWADSRSRSGQD